MKKTWTKYFSVLLAVMLFTACGSENGQNTETQANSGQEKAADQSTAETKADRQEAAEEESGQKGVFKVLGILVPAVPQKYAVFR